jgi:manganese/zinc/iron transport system permease protein
MDASNAGSMATMVGVLFVVTFLLAPNRGLIAIARRRARQRWQFAQMMLAIHLFNHEGLPEAEDESRIEHLHEHMRWEPGFATQVVTRAENAGIISRRDGYLALTEEGRQVARQAIVR